MAKYYRRRRFYRKGKYNIENRPVEFQAPTTPENNFYQNSVQIVPPSTTEGVRQVARMTITLTSRQTSGTDSPGIPIYWAIVYIPEGAVTSALFPNSTTLFNPSSYVLASGISDPNAGPIRISSRLRKNLNANDQIFLLTATNGAGERYQGLVRYAIKYN